MMKFKVHDVDIATGGTLVAILNRKDAVMLDVHTGDRLRLTRGSKSTVAVLDIAGTGKSVKRGQIGLMEEVLKKLGARQGNYVHISLDEKPRSISFIRNKLDGKDLSETELRTIVEDIVNNRLTSVEIAYFVCGSYVCGLSLEETVALTRSMIRTGDVLKFERHPIVDKHCIGGVAGNRTTCIVVPLLVAAGYCVPKTSSRAITSPSGTADTMEVLCDVNLDADRIRSVVETVGGCMVWGGSINLAPADDKIITVEHPLSIDAEGQLLASILAKKGSVSATHILVDIPVGRGAKVRRMDKAKRLRDQFFKVGKKLGMTIKVMITDGSQPIGNGIGPALEARDVLWVLQGHEDAPEDLKKKSLLMASRIMKAYPMPGKKAKHGYRYAKELLESGAAWKKMEEIIRAQGHRVTDWRRIRLGKHRFVFRAWKNGKLKHIDNRSVSRIARVAGAPFDKGAGIYLHCKVGDKVKRKDPLFTIYTENKQKMKYARDFLKQYDGIVIG